MREQGRCSRWSSMGVHDQQYTQVMDKVNFITLQNDEDIVISFSFDEGTEFGIDGFTIQRNPGLELFLDKDDRGACIEWLDEDDIRVVLDVVNISREVITMKTKGKVYHYSFDIGNISDDEYTDLVEHFRLINFDNSISIS